MDHSSIKTLAELKKAGYQSKTIKQELRDNLVAKLSNDEPIFENPKQAFNAANRTFKNR